MDDRYYTEEINYLLEQGREFARKHPQKARMLHLDDIRSRDPNVERLIESLAFLTSRIRKRLDDDFSQIANGLLSLMWPAYLNPVPSFCLLEFRPQLWDFTEVATVPANAEIDSQPTSAGIRCRFRTCFSTTVLPLKITGARVESVGSQSVLTLSFTLANGANLASLAGHKLRLQLLGELFNCFQLYNLILGKKGKNSFVETIAVDAFDEEKNVAASKVFGPGAISPTGLSREEAVLPLTKSALWSFSLIRDFFVFPEKFQAFELDILNFISEQSDLAGFDVSLHLKSPWPSNLRINKDHFRVNTVPIVNLFTRDADPIRLDHFNHRYTVRGDIKSPEFYQVYSIESVEGIEVGTGRRKTYEPLFAAHRGSDIEQTNYYSLDREKSSWGGIEYYISFVGASAELALPEEEVISLSLTCTNARLTNELLPNQITEIVSGINNSFRPTNISHPTQFVLPNIEKNSLWRWLSHASLNYLNIYAKEQFKSILTLHDFSESDANRHKIEGIQAIALKSIRRLFKGAIVPGNLVEITVNEKHFTDFGEIQLFARVLSAFLASYASINSYVQLLLKAEPSGNEILIQPRLGENIQL